MSVDCRGYFFFSSRRRHTRFDCDWSSDVCSSDLRPFHDWNERIHAECYQPNCAVQIVDKDSGTVRLVNNYQNISFDFGPTLLWWLEDRKSTRLNSSHSQISYAVFCLKKKK